MPDQEVTYDPNSKRYDTRTTINNADVQAAGDKERLQDASKLGALEKTKPKASGRPMPKMADYGGDLGKYGEAMRSWRNENDAAGATADVQSQKKAIGSMP